MEARIARIESDVSHLREDVSDIKLDVRTLRDKLDGIEIRLTGKTKAGDTRLEHKIDEMDRRLGGKIDSLQASLHSAKVWALALYIVLAGAMLGTMARGFGWL